MGLEKGGVMPDYEKIAEEVEVGGGGDTKSPGPAEIDLKTLRNGLQTYPVGHEKYQGLAAAKGYDQSDKNVRLQSLRYTHEAMIDAIIAEPGIKQNELAKIFSRSVAWISRIVGSDAFQAALAKRREEVSDPFLIATIEERMRGLAYQSLDIITEKLANSQNVDLALKGLDIASKSLGFGARAGGPGQTNQFIIQLPPKSPTSGDWVESHHPMKQAGSDNA